MSVKRYAGVSPVISRVLVSRSYRGGTGTITGTAKVGAAPIQCRVFLFEYPSMVQMDMQMTDAAGNYSFKFLDTNYRYAVTAQHPTALYNNVIAVNITPVQV
jgi:hypothetical protein